MLGTRNREDPEEDTNLDIMDSCHPFSLGVLKGLGVDPAAWMSFWEVPFKETFDTLAQ